MDLQSFDGLARAISFIVNLDQDQRVSCGGVSIDSTATARSQVSIISSQNQSSHGKDYLAYGRLLLDHLFTKQEQKLSLLAEKVQLLYRST